jgi:hypothetical protein
MGRNAKLKAKRRDRAALERAWQQLCQEYPPELLLEEDQEYANQKAQALLAYPYPTSDGEPYVIEGWINMAMEYIAIGARDRTEWQEGLYLLLDGCLSFSSMDWHSSDYSPTAKQNIRKAGEILNQVGGFQEMCHTIETWVPREFHRSIEIFWDGIGQWIA